MNIQEASWDTKLSSGEYVLELVPSAEYVQSVLTAAKHTNTVCASSFLAQRPLVIGTTNCPRSTDSPNSSAVHDGIFQSDLAPLFSFSGIMSASGDSCGCMGSGFHPPWSGVKSNIYTAQSQQSIPKPEFGA
ncbi:unnamed protein product [Phytophthora lilii]|uniref:Unnamed protein product n=1 Tax=Phytophthora lilii TaxID=2077276 RepID=A0A9W6TWQ4_9STRA|nr:unnamed protein product [Phytophthora lilii]